MSCKITAEKILVNRNNNDKKNNSYTKNISWKDAEDSYSIKIRFNASLLNFGSIPSILMECHT